MFRFTFTLFLCLSLLFPHQWNPFPQIAYAQQTETPARRVEHLAILDFDAKGGITKDEASIITERFRAQILRTGRFKIMERAKMQEILKEQGFQQSSFCDTTDCSVEVGRLLSVKQILTGSVSKFGNLYTLSARVMDVEKGHIIIEEFEDCECRLEEILTRSTALLVNKLAGTPAKIVPTPTASPPQILGTVTIHSQPQGAEVLWNGKPVGKTPLILRQQPPGIYQISLEHASYPKINRTVTVKSGQNTVNLPLVEPNTWILWAFIGGFLVVAGVVSMLVIQAGGSSTANTGSRVLVTW